MTNHTRPRVALLGLGTMGAGMARNLLRKGFPLAVWNRTRERAAPFADEGARVADSPRDAADGAAVVVAMVADDAASRSVWLGDDGALGAMASGAVAVESSTVTPEWIAELSEAATQHGCELLDAPVTGSRTQANAGELRFLVGGTAAALERARPALEAMGSTVLHVGPSGSGALLKLVNNFLCGVQAASMAEALALVERAGLDRATAVEVITNGAPGSPLVKNFATRMTSRTYTPPSFHLELMAKDLAYAQRAAARHGVTLTTAAPAEAAFERAKSSGLGQLDVSAVVEPLRSEEVQTG